MTTKIDRFIMTFLPTPTHTEKNLVIKQSISMAKRSRNHVVKVDSLQFSQTGCKNGLCLLVENNRKKTPADFEQPVLICITK